MTPLSILRRKFIGESAVFLSALKKLLEIAPSHAGVLITGETGTGKGLCAHAIHTASLRAALPFCPVNCGGVPEHLFESELFGHEKGAFTGADSASLGILRSADGGTVFLDEVDNLLLASQAKLLTFLAEKAVRPVGSHKLFKVDVRIIAATNANLEEAVRVGKLRLDLAQRLDVLRLHLPPLRERAGDPALIAQSFLAAFARAEGRGVTGLSPAALKKLDSYHWPGNVRELEHVMHRSVLGARGPIIQADEIDLRLPANGSTMQSFMSRKEKMLQEWHATEIRQALLAHQGNVTHAARAMGLDPRQLRQLITRYHLGSPNQGNNH